MAPPQADNQAGTGGRLGAAPPDGLPVRERLARLAEQHYRSIYNLVYSYIGGDPEEAEDLTLQTFENAFAAAHRFRGDADVRTWIFRIAINVCKNRIRHKQTRRRFEAFSLDAPQAGNPDDELCDPVEIADDTLSPYALAEGRELRQILRKGIAELSEDYRTVLLLKLEGLSYREIAHVLGVTVETIKSRLFRARVALKQKVSHYVEGI